MSTVSLDIPESLLRAAREQAGKEGVPLEQLAAVALAEKVSALQALAFLRERAARGNLDDFERVLEKVPNLEPEHDEDRFP